MDIDWTQEEGEFHTARVLFAGQGRDETLRRSKSLREGYREFAHRYTGEMQTPLYPINLILYS